jgi:hypothetical protein
MEKQTEQAVENTASVEDRIGAKFERMFGMSDEPEQPESDEPEGEQAEGDEPEAKAADEAKSEEGSEDVVEVEFNGQTYQVPKELKDALMATKDYTQKTTEVSQLRKSVELQQKEAHLFNEQRKFHESVAGDLDQLKMLTAYIDHVNKTTDWQKLPTTEAFSIKMQLDQMKDQRAELDKALQGKYATFKAQLDAEREKLSKEMDDVLSKSIPKFTPDTKAALQKYAKDMGYPAQALDGMSALDYQVIWKASQYDAVKSEAKAVVSKATTPVIKPTARQEMPKAVQDKLNYRKAIKKASGTQKKALVEDRIGQIFGA